MNSIKSNSFSMKPQEIRSLPSGTSQKLKVLRGQIWLTAEGDVTDYILCSGESLQISSQSLGILLQNLSDNALLEICEIK